MKKVSVKKLTLKRDINLMPKHIRELLIRRGLMELYKAWPPYQQNDCLGWISRAKLETTMQKRIQQMVEELKLGDRLHEYAVERAALSIIFRGGL